MEIEDAVVRTPSRLEGADPAIAKVSVLWEEAVTDNPA